MPRLRWFLKYWLPVLVWMAVIFCASADSQSFAHSSRLFGPFIHWLLPGLSATAQERAVFFLRKCCHATEYALLALLLWRALRSWLKPAAFQWHWRLAAWTALLCLLYAASDEFHQLFVPTREGCLTDVLIDTAGAVLALLFLRALGGWRQRR